MASKHRSFRFSLKPKYRIRKAFSRRRQASQVQQDHQGLLWDLRLKVLGFGFRGGSGLSMTYTPHYSTLVGFVKESSKARVLP